MVRLWQVELRGGAFDGWGGATPQTPVEVLIAWRCGPRCGGHATFDLEEPAIVLRTAESYRRVEMDPDARRAVYEVGEQGPRRDVEERELVEGGALVGAALALGQPPLQFDHARLESLKLTEGHVGFAGEVGEVPQHNLKCLEHRPLGVLLCGNLDDAFFALQLSVEDRRQAHEEPHEVLAEGLLDAPEPAYGLRRRFVGVLFGHGPDLRPTGEGS